eukprot:maker-scaffold84_size396325-snap-gene-2.49 protein:Tk09699 transcript:maker-scaffold84_size396325-snap-gene-2.49-mRNA-1 annotation:"transmembrane protein 47-like"
MGITIETITVTRPMKVIAFVSCFITTFFMVAACATTDWIMTSGWREGLWEQCVDIGAPTPLPFNNKPIPGCHRAHSAGYIKATAALVVVVAFTDFFATILTGLGLRSTDPNKKYKYYRVAIYALLIATICLLVALILYPVSFSKELKGAKKFDVFDGGMVEAYTGTIDFDGDGIMDYEDDDDDNDGKPDHLDPDDDNDGIPDIRRVWTFGFGYGVSWASFILIFMALVLLICDRESEEIFYKEKEVDDEEDEEA